MKTLEVVLELPGDGMLEASVEVPNSFIATAGNSLEEIETNLRQLLAEYLEHEGAGVDIDPSTVTFSYVYDLQAFFAEFEALKITSIAKAAGLNGSQLRQYATGKRYAKKSTVERIETAVHELGRKMASVVLASTKRIQTA